MMINKNLFLLFLLIPLKSFSSDIASYGKVDGTVSSIDLSGSSLTNSSEDVYSSSRTYASSYKDVVSDIEKLSEMVSANVEDIESVSSTTTSSFDLDDIINGSWSTLYSGTMKSTSVEVPSDASYIAISGMVVRSDATGVIFSYMPNDGGVLISYGSFCKLTKSGSSIKGNSYCDTQIAIEYM